MFSLVQKRRWFYLFSASIIIPGLIIVFLSIVQTGKPFHLSIDFSGGSIYELKFTSAGITEGLLREKFAKYGDANPIIQALGTPDENRWSIRSSIEDPAQGRKLVEDLNSTAPIDKTSQRIEQVSGTIGQEVTRAAIFAVAVGTIVVTSFIILAFRQVPDAFRYGVCAIIAMIHDVLVVSAAMSLAGLLFKWELDSLFLTATLMVVGFSVQDTIVLYDRIRENIPKYLGEPYETIVNRSILETIHRSLMTQISVFFIMIAILLFGGASVKQFVTILFIGLLTGSYSTICIAVPLLVSWEKGEFPFVLRRQTLTTQAEG